jgi:hypothetical protein
MSFHPCAEAFAAFNADLARLPPPLAREYVETLLTVFGRRFVLDWINCTLANPNRSTEECDPEPWTTTGS